MSVYYLPKNRKPLALTERHSVFQRKRSYSWIYNSIRMYFSSMVGWLWTRALSDVESRFLDTISTGYFSGRLRMSSI